MTVLSRKGFEQRTAANRVFIHPAYRPDIDGMRALAVLAVVVFHAFPESLRGGFIGVDVFFVISGFLITSIILSNLNNDSFSFGTFYMRRINRLFPALILVLFSCLCFGLLVLMPEELRQLGRHVAGGATFVSNFILLGESGYFDNASESKILLHLWSLGIEEQFYLLWPLAAWAAWKCRINLLLLTALLITLSFALNIAVLQENASSAFYSPQTRFWELLAGAALAGARTRPPGRVIANLLSITGLALLGCTLLSITKADAFPGWWAVLPVGGAVLLIAAGPQALFNRHVLGCRPMVWLGLISYPLYLWHWPVLTYARIMENGQPSVDVALYAVGLSLVLAWLTWRLVETPLKKFAGLGTTLALSALLAGAGIAGYYVQSSKGLPDRDAITHLNRVHAQFVGSYWAYMQNDICAARAPHADSKNYAWWFCIQNKDAEPTLMLLGTSYANQLFPGLARHPALDHHTVLSIGTCDPANPDIAKEGSVEKIHPCSGQRPLQQKRLINGIIERSATVRYAIIDGLREAPDAEYAVRLERYIAELEQRNVTAIVFLPHLAPGYDPKACFPGPYRKPVNDCSLPHDKSIDINESYAPIITAIEARYPDTRFFDQKVLTCREGSCSAMLDGMPLFRDVGHLSEFGSEKLAQIFVEWAEKNVPQLLAP